MQGTQGHGAVDDDRHLRERTGGHQAAELDEHQLGAVDREGGHEHGTAAFQGPAQDVGERLVVGPGVNTIPVRGLDDDGIRGAHSCRTGQQWVAATTEVATEQRCPVPGSQPYQRRPEDVTRWLENHRHPVSSTR